MKGFTKTVLRVSAVILITGLILAGAGALSGAKMEYSNADFDKLIQGTAIYDWIH